jgi:transketolase
MMEKMERVKQLESVAIDMRQKVLTMIHTAGSGHPGGSLSATDMMTALYHYEMNVDPKDPKKADRDRFVLSKGHVCPALYSALLSRGFLEEDEIYTLRKYGSRLQGHPDMKKTPGVDISTGSLGQGISAAVGMALGLKRDQSSARVFAMLGDGECAEGQVWEAVQAASKYELDNLTIYIDMNGLQNDGFTEDIMPLRNLADKFAAFGCEVFEIDGHKMNEIIEALDKAREVKGKPKCIIGKGVKGRGVSFMENVAMWHGVAPNEEEFKTAMADVAGGLI